LLGRLAKDKLKRQLILLPIASGLFFLVSNFGVWYFWYPHTWAGLFSCYLLAVPFYRNTMLGDFVFGYSFLLIKHWSKVKTKIASFLNLSQPLLNK